MPYSLIEYDGDFDEEEGIMRLSDLITEEVEVEETHPILDDQDYTPESNGSSLIPFGPHQKSAEKKNCIHQKRNLRWGKKPNLFAVLICYLVYLKPDAKHLGALLNHLSSFFCGCYCHCELNMLIRTRT